MLVLFVVLTVGVALAGPLNTLYAQSGKPLSPADLFLGLFYPEERLRLAAFEGIKRDWEDSFIPMALETSYLHPEGDIRLALLELLQEKTGQSFGADINAWYEWIWNRPANVHEDYPEFKSKLYRLIDPKFEKYFSKERKTRIRLDEVRWGGVAQDGIPPLRRPTMIPADAAKYLKDEHVVFGIEVNGDVRAYPKRVLAWHELFVDKVGDTPIAGVYCTLCGSMIVYKTEFNDMNHELGTSGFLYRSNKLMYDRATQSLWSTLLGEPVIGPLVGQGISLERLYLVTTTWGEWKKRHPETKVLSIETGHKRDYSEGAAYREYFATDDLMFNVPKLDTRLNNKAEVLGLIFREAPNQALAISTEHLLENRIYHDQLGELSFVVLTDESGANRVYETKGVRFKDWDGVNSVQDSEGVHWSLSESKLQAEDGRTLYRLPAHRAFWFGWFSAYSHTKLVYS